MYQDINIKNPIFLSSFILIILSLPLIYRKQNYFAKVRNFELHICQKSAIKALFHSIFILNSAKKCHNGTFLFFSEKLVHFKLILDCEPKTWLLAPTTPHLEFLCQNRPFLAQICVLPLKSSCPVAPHPTYCMHSSAAQFHIIQDAIQL